MSPKGQSVKAQRGRVTSDQRLTFEPSHQRQHGQGKVGGRADCSCGKDVHSVQSLYSAHVAE